ncbi:MAG: hypothetical protein WD993_09225 [Thermoleophilaceae bacterium]
MEFKYANISIVVGLTVLVAGRLLVGGDATDFEAQVVAVAAFAVGMATLLMFFELQDRRGGRS